MVFLRRKSSNLLVFIDDNILIYNDEDKSEKILKLPDPISNANHAEHSELFKLESRKVISVSVSKNSGYIGVSLLNKQLIIYDDKFELIKNTVTKRAASKIRFAHGNEGVIVADKTGDVLLYNLRTDLEPKLLLGHLSMLLDVVMSECGRYIISCDRDEKIRVSSYPNSYNIVAYCLGHQEFVTNLEVVGNLLVSGSGDGTVHFWEFSTGKDVSSINTNDFLKDKDTIEKFCKSMDEENVTVSAIPITDMQVYYNNDTEMYIGINLLNINEIQLYRARYSLAQLDSQFLGSVALDSELVCFNLDEQLFILTDKELLVYILSGNTYVKSKGIEIGSFYKRHKDLFTGVSRDSDSILPLYKRKFDNVQQYLSKKRVRIESKS